MAEKEKEKERQRPRVGIHEDHFYNNTKNETESTAQVLDWDANSPYYDYFVRLSVFRLRGFFFGLGNGFYGKSEYMAEDMCLDDTVIITFEAMLYTQRNGPLVNAVIETIATAINFIN